MPVLMGKDDVQAKTISGFKFSAVPVSKLGATEYTVVSIIEDVSGSVYDYKKDLEGCLKTVVESCCKSPRAENLLLRLVAFNHNLDELHGFKELKDINVADYDDILDIDGRTALFDAVLSGLEATQQYAEELYRMDYLSNAVIFIVTDGLDNESRIGSPDKIKKAIDEIRKKEILESVQVVLIGVGTDRLILDGLEEIKDRSGIDQFVKIGEATPSKLAKLAQFISQSISSSSQALGSGGASQPVQMVF
jgi:uncharacterized protein YegL